VPRREDGIYVVAANVRLDHADVGWFSAAVLTNAEQSWESGMSALNGDLADSQDDLCLVGLRNLAAGDFLSVWIYSNGDSDYTISNDGASTSISHMMKSHFLMS
jgi:hypothetical protein